MRQGQSHMSKKFEHLKELSVNSCRSLKHRTGCCLMLSPIGTREIRDTVEKLVSTLYYCIRLFLSCHFKGKGLFVWFVLMALAQCEIRPSSKRMEVMRYL
ncbi:hypothetical protein BDV30DRAFT_206376 [Aspergillus minisclerotigenes]|uniref:Uncharacterized protein n=1 Tax=Aspergillus minisclerotigenes TaxID=656917 RepID=A0A5N6JCQ1_9EURO|nr:hypothetical protein BDV30DRAFT_206376 [Aspergillus minisclerotigenes]